MKKKKNISRLFPELSNVYAFHHICWDQFKTTLLTTLEKLGFFFCLTMLKAQGLINLLDFLTLFHTVPNINFFEYL